MLKLTQFNLKQFFFYVGILMSIFFLINNLLMIKHYRVDRQIIVLEKEFQKLNIEEKKLRANRESLINKAFKENRSHLKKYSIKNIPLVTFE